MQFKALTRDDSILVRSIELFTWEDILLASHRTVGRADSYTVSHVGTGISLTSAHHRNTTRAKERALFELNARGKKVVEDLLKDYEVINQGALDKWDAQQKAKARRAANRVPKDGRAYFELMPELPKHLKSFLFVVKDVDVYNDDSILSVTKHSAFTYNGQKYKANELVGTEYKFKISKLREAK